MNRVDKLGKVIFIIVLSLMIILSSQNIVFSNKFIEHDTVELYDGTTKRIETYKVINIVMEGKDMISDVPAVISVIDGKARTLVPISFIANEIGADVSWNGKEKIATIEFKDKKIELKIGSEKAKVNSKEYILPDRVPARILSYNGNGRTMVPVRFVTEQLGYEVFWEGETSTATISKKKQVLANIRYDNTKSYPEIRFKLSGEPSVNAYSIDGKKINGDNSVVIDFYNTDIKLKNELKYGKYIINDYIDEIYSVEFKELVKDNVKTLEASVDLGAFRSIETSYDDLRNEIVVRLINSVKSIETEEISGQTALVVESNENPAFNIVREDHKVYLDIIDARLLAEDLDNEIQVNKSGFKSYSYKQMDNSDYYDKGTRFSRVEINLDKNSSSQNVFAEVVDSKIYVFVIDDQKGHYSYSNDYVNKTSSLSIEVNKNIDVDIKKEGNLLKFTINKADLLKDIEVGNSEIDDGIAKSIEVKEDGNKYLFLIELFDDVKYGESKSNSLFSLNMANPTLKNSENQNKIIVLDAGHGGHDPGAVSAGYQEKDFALKATKMLKKALSNKGYKVYMTRDADNYVQLRDRADIANKLDAYIFVSIHINAMGHNDTKARGIETLYKDDGRNSKVLAKFVQNGLMKYTKQVNRGIVNRPRLAVLNKTKMPAVLVELGFITSPADRKLLLTDDYLKECVDGIVEGIQNYDK